MKGLISFLHNLKTFLLLSVTFLHQEVVSSFLLLLIFLGFIFVDPGSVVGWVTSECNVHELEEFVHTCDKGLRGSTVSLFGRLTVKHDNFISHIGSHDKIVLYDKSGALSLHNPPLHYFSGNYSLFRV